MPTITLKLMPGQMSAITEVIQSYNGSSTDDLILQISKRLSCKLETASKKICSLPQGSGQQTETRGTARWL